MLHGIVLMSIPCTFFVAEFARPLVTVLFQRGQFTPEAAVLTSDILRISAFSLIISSLLAPMVRLFQILDRISYSHVLYLVSLVCTAAFQYVLVFRMGWDVYGIAWASLANSAVVTLVVARLVRRCGVIVAWRRVFGHALFAAAVSIVAAAVSSGGAAPICRPAGAHYWKRAIRARYCGVLFPGAPALALDCRLAASHLTAADERLYCLGEQDVWAAR